MIAQVGDVLVLPFFSHKEDKKNGESRWAIIIEDLGSEFLFIGLTKQVNQKPHYPDGFIIQKKSVEGSQMGLEYDSLVCCGKLGVRKEFRLPKKFVTIPPIIKKGICSEFLLDKIISLCP